MLMLEMADENSPQIDWEFLYAELQRRIDYQIHAVRRLEDQATRVLRMLFTAIGVLLTGLYLVLTIEISGRIEYIGSFSLVSTLQESANSIPLLRYDQGLLIVTLMFIISITIFLGAVVALANVFREALSVLSPSLIEPGLDIKKLGNYRKNHRGPSRKSMLDDYFHQISTNEAQLLETRAAWRNCYESLVRSVRQFVKAGVVFWFLLTTDYIPILAAIVYLSISPINFLWDSISLSGIRRLFRLHLFTDIPITIFTGFFISYHTNIVPIAENQRLALFSGFVLIVASLIFVYGAVRLTNSDLLWLSGRSVLFASYSGIVLLFLVIGLDLDDVLGEFALETLLLSIFGSNLLAAIGLFVVLGVKLPFTLLRDNWAILTMKMKNLLNSL